MTRETEAVVARAKVREAAGVFRAREQLDDAITALLLAGFDRADIDLMASVDAVRRKLGGAYVAAEFRQPGARIVGSGRPPMSNEPLQLRVALFGQADL